MVHSGGDDLNLLSFGFEVKKKLGRELDKGKLDNLLNLARSLYRLQDCEGQPVYSAPEIDTILFALTSGRGRELLTRWTL